MLDQLRILICSVAILAAMGSSTNGQEPAKEPPIRALLILGGCCHDYEHQKDVLTEGISARANVKWTVAYDPDNGTSHLNPIFEKDDWAKDFDVVVHDECIADVKDLKIIDRVLKPHRDGLPAVILHCGMHSFRSEGWPDKTTPWFEFTGLATTSHGPQVPIEVTTVDAENPIMKGLDDWTTGKEELYNNYTGNLLSTATPLARGRQIYKNEKSATINTQSVVTWTNLYREKTRVFATTLGHNTETVSDPRYLDLVTRGLLWSVKKDPK